MSSFVITFYYGSGSAEAKGYGSFGSFSGSATLTENENVRLDSISNFGLH
jgi:hypothetical protein